MLSAPVEKFTNEHAPELAVQNGCYYFTFALPGMIYFCSLSIAALFILIDKSAAQSNNAFQADGYSRIVLREVHWFGTIFIRSLNATLRLSKN